MESLSSPQDFLAPLQEEGGYHQAVLEGVGPGSLYFFRLEGEKERPDPASRFQPQGVHGPSQVMDPVLRLGGSAAGSAFPSGIMLSMNCTWVPFSPEGDF